MAELNFKGKEFVYNHHLAVPFRPLVPRKDKGIGPVALDGNLVIHGDNLHALKSLLPLYAGKVDCIFIDPPYNTGNEGWCYNDNVNAPMIKEWLDSNPVGIEDGLRHGKWCAMMWPRLRLLRELLADTGMYLGIEFVSLTEGVDTSTPTGRMIFTVLGAVAELERSLIAERVRAGLRNAKAKGKKLGRPRLVADRSQIARLRAQGCPIREIAAKLGAPPWLCS